MKRLVDSWISAEKELYGHNISEAIKLLNENHDTRLTHSRVSEWRRGVYTPSPVVLSRLLYRTLPWAIAKAGIPVSEAQRVALEDLLWETGVEDGERYVELL